MDAVIKIDNKSVKSQCVVVDKMIPGVDFILGIDILKWFKFSLVNGNASICAAAYQGSSRSGNCEGEIYELQRLGFGLNCAPEIMKSVVSKVLSLNERISAATDHYYDDIIVDLDQVTVDEVTQFLAKYGLVCKAPEKIESATVLGLKMHKVKDSLRWSRSNDLCSIEESPKTKREVFSACGKLTGHYPVAGWLRVAASFVKRLCQGSSWDDFAGNEALEKWACLIARLRTDDPVRGVWRVPSCGVWKLWCDASKLAIGALLESNGQTIEDGAWLRKEDDGSHINLAELNAVVKGVNMAMKWNVKKLTVITDSASVHAWLQSLCTKDKRIKASGLSEMLVRRRLVLLDETLQSYNVEWVVELVASQCNKADALTRVPKEWLRKKREFESPVAAVAHGYPCRDSDEALVEKIHRMNHRGADATMHFVKSVSPTTPMEVVKEVIRNCDVCKSIDPDAMRIADGSLDVKEVWQRIAIDVTHLGSSKYLTFIDCGPSRFAIWRRITTECDVEVVGIVKQVFSEFGPTLEILCDNAKSFTSRLMRQLCESWGVKLVFRCANRPSGNGIVERHHRTLKRMCARTKASVEECVYWYNVTPRSEDQSVPSKRMFARQWYNPFLHLLKSEPEDEQIIESNFETGDSVWVKPIGARCTSQWNSGVVTRVLSAHKVLVDGVPRHVKDIRRKTNQSQHFIPGASPVRAPLFWEEDRDEMRQEGDENTIGDGDEASQEVRGTTEDTTLRRSTRVRRPPSHLVDYVLDDDGDE